MFVFVASLMSYLRYLCLLVYSGVQHILCFTFFVFVLCTKDRCSTKVKTDRGYTSWIDARQLCSKYVYTGSVLYGDRECIPETYSSGEERDVVVLSSRLWDEIVNVPSWLWSMHTSIFLIFEEVHLSELYM